MIRTRIFGRYDDRDVTEVLLESGDASVALLSYGCVVRDWRVPLGGRRLPVILGYERLEDYLADSFYFGALVGRVANRIAGGRFLLDGKTRQLACNDGPNHLHGGARGLSRRVWNLETDSAATRVRLSYHSPDGEEGYPGAVDFSIDYRLEGNRLICEMEGRPDRPTPINLANHNYYNLAPEGDTRGHVLQIEAERYTPLDEALIPTGEIRAVEGTRFDFQAPRSFREADPEDLGYDLNYVLPESRDPKAPVASLACPESGLWLRLWSDQPGLQLFNAEKVDLPAPGLEGRRHGPFCGVCLEAQHFPDSPNRPAFPSIVRTPEKPYRQRLEVEIAPAAD